MAQTPRKLAFRRAGIDAQRGPATYPLPHCPGTIMTPICGLFALCAWADCVRRSVSAQMRVIVKHESFSIENHSRAHTCEDLQTFAPLFTVLTHRVHPYSLVWRRRLRYMNPRTFRVMRGKSCAKRYDPSRNASSLDGASRRMLMAIGVYNASFRQRYRDG